VATPLTSQGPTDRLFEGCTTLCVPLVDRFRNPEPLPHRVGRRCHAAPRQRPVRPRPEGRLAAIFMEGAVLQLSLSRRGRQRVHRVCRRPRDGRLSGVRKVGRSRGRRRLLFSPCATRVACRPRPRPWASRTYGSCRLPLLYGAPVFEVLAPPAAWTMPARVLKAGAGSKPPTRSRRFRSRRLQSRQ